MIDPRKFIPLLLGGFIALIAIVLALNYVVTTHSVTVKYTDVTNVTITKHEGNSDQTVATVNKSGDSVRLPNDTDYTIHYTAANDFASGTQPLSKNTNEITLTPEYSAAKNASLMAEALPAARNLIAQKYPQADTLYTLTSSGMRERGKWLLVKLTFKGDYDYNSDNLKILLEKKNGTWQLDTKPDIVFTQITYPSIPLDVLSWADSL